MSFYAALVGNPNCGKTTMFNALTGSAQYVGNWPGVTVEKKEGKLKGNIDVVMVDLPGIYSLSPYTPEEIVSRNFIIDESPDLIINIVDGTNLERNLYLTTQLAELGVPMIIAVNMIDMLKSRGLTLDIELLSKRLGIPVMPISASKGIGIDELTHKAIHMLHDTTHQLLGRVTDGSDLEKFRHADELHMQLHKAHEGLHTVSEPYHPIVKNFYSRSVDNAITAIEYAIAPALDDNKYCRFNAVKLFEDDPITEKSLALDEAAAAEVERIKEEIPLGENIDRQMIIADMRYKFICKICAEAVDKSREDNALTTSDKIDKVVTNRGLAIPVFLGIMLLIFYITFGPIGSFLSDGVSNFIDGTLTETVRSVFRSAGAADWATGLICDGVISGVGAVLSFLPQIMLLFFFLSVLEDSGYMSRAAFIMDRPLRKIGLSGKAFVPMLMGFGCSVPAIMATRTLESEKDKRITVLVTPFMSCSARMPVYALFISAFFTQSRPAIIFSMYLIGIVVAILVATALNHTILKGEPDAFVMELPAYRLPTAKGLLLHIWERLKDFLTKAGTILLGASVVIWFLQSFDSSLHMVSDSGSSLFADLGRFIAPAFAPCGFGFWQASVALLSGLVAKESIISTFGILYSGSNIAASLATVFTPLSAFSFLVFVLLYVPCMATVSAMLRELKSAKWTALSVAISIGTAWCCSMLTFQIGSFLGF